MCTSITPPPSSKKTAIPVAKKNIPEIKKPSRSYSKSTLKVLFATSMNLCAKPGCNQIIVEKKTKHSKEATIGEIAHIYAFSEDGPRGRNGLKAHQINEPGNLILLCPTHHAIVDIQHETYPASMLLKWKEDHSTRFKERLGATMGDIGYSELEIAAKALMAPTSSSQNSDLRIITPANKLKQNQLGQESELLITMGAAKSYLVEQMLINASQFDQEFPDRLKEGFSLKYNEFIDSGLSGDELFAALCEWSEGTGGNLARAASGLCILAHLFIICDIFEK